MGKVSPGSTVNSLGDPSNVWIIVILLYKNHIKAYHFIVIYTEYYMSKSVSHAVSTREPYITPRSTGPRGDIGWGLIRHVIQILTCNVHYIIYFNQWIELFPLSNLSFFKFLYIFVFVSFGPILIFIYIHNNSKKSEKSIVKF